MSPYGYSLRGAMLLITAAGLLLAMLRNALTPPATSAEEVLGVVSQFVLVFFLCPPWIPILLLLRHEARRLDDHRR